MSRQLSLFHLLALEYLQQLWYSLLILHHREVSEEPHHCYHIKHIDLAICGSTSCCTFFVCISDTKVQISAMFKRKKHKLCLHIVISSLQLTYGDTLLTQVYSKMTPGMVTESCVQSWFYPVPHHLTTSAPCHPPLTQTPQ